jgi:hypothetical protein
MRSRKFLPFLSTHATLQDIGSPSGISPLRFLCIGFRYVNNVADCFYTLNDAYRFRDMRIPGVYPEPVEGAYGVLCVRFVSLVRVCRSLNRLQRSAGHATLDTGGWLDLMKTILCLPVRDFHPERNDKLRLPH